MTTIYNMLKPFNFKAIACFWVAIWMTFVYRLSLRAISLDQFIAATVILTFVIYHLWRGELYLKFEVFY